MNPYTGGLGHLSKDESERDGLHRLPAELQKQAQLKLRLGALPLLGPAEPTARVNLRGASPLAQWARKKRKAKQAAASRRRNRK